MCSSRPGSQCGLGTDCDKPLYLSCLLLLPWWDPSQPSFWLCLSLPRAGLSTKGLHLGRGAEDKAGDSLHTQHGLCNHRKRTCSSSFAWDR